MLQDRFILLLRKYTHDEPRITELWAELERLYSEKHRHYHTLAHLDNLFAELEEVRAAIGEWDTICFSVFYHDAIYNVKKQDNEEKSAELAIQRLTSVSIPVEMIARCNAQILATKSHTLSDDTDTNLFTDADLSVLGKEWEAYARYAAQVRKEYSIYPDFLYKPGRKKVLQHFLAMERIYKTGLFFERYEAQAKENMRRELEQL